MNIIKNPNSYGTVARLSGNRRKPFVIRKTIGWNDKGHPIYDTIGYCETREEGLMILAEYNRIVPIHSRIVQIVQRRKDQGNKYLFSYEGKKLSNSQYYIFWNDIMEQLGMGHTFRSRLDSAGANKVCIDLMMGHKSKEVGERIYTHKTIQELKEAIELIDKKRDEQN